MHTYRVISFLPVKTSLREETSGRAEIAAWVKKVKQQQQQKKKKQAGRVGRRRTGIDRSMQMSQKKMHKKICVGHWSQSTGQCTVTGGWGGGGKSTQEKDLKDIR